MSGLNRLDDRLVDGRPVTRSEVGAAIDAAHGTLATGCAAAALSCAWAGAVLAGTGGRWAPTTAALLGAALILRLRAFPLRVEVVSLVAAGLFIGGALVLRWADGDATTWLLGVLGCLTVTAVALVVLVRPPDPYWSARARTIADQLEGLVVLALLPAVVGVFGVYPRLLETF
jgi:hypothetical protein